jgi:hypothetical protein
VGNITDVKVISGNARLVPPAVAVVKRFPYRPVIRSGHPVRLSAEVDIPCVLHPVTQREIYDCWTSCRDAARSLRKDGRVDASVAKLQEALGHAEKIGPIEVADTYGDLAELYIREGRDAEAEPLLVQRLHTLQHSRIQDELEIANTEADLGGVYILLRRPRHDRCWNMLFLSKNGIFATQRCGAPRRSTPNVLRSALGTPLY